MKVSLILTGVLAVGCARSGGGQKPAPAQHPHSQPVLGESERQLMLREAELRANLSQLTPPSENADSLRYEGRLTSAQSGAMRQLLASHKAYVDAAQALLEIVEDQDIRQLKLLAEREMMRLDRRLSLNDFDKTLDEHLEIAELPLGYRDLLPEPLRIGLESGQWPETIANVEQAGREYLELAAALEKPIDDSEDETKWSQAVSRRHSRLRDLLDTVAITRGGTSEIALLSATALEPSRIKRTWIERKQTEVAKAEIAPFVANAELLEQRFLELSQYLGVALASSSAVALRLELDTIQGSFASVQWITSELQAMQSLLSELLKQRADLLASPLKHPVKDESLQRYSEAWLGAYSSMLSDLFDEQK
jgi:hypothetical protein